MFQHTGQHIKRRPTCCPETEGVTPLLFELSAINGGVSTEKEIWWSYIRQQAWALAPWYDHHALLRVYAGVFYPYCGIAVLGVHLYYAQQAQHIAHALLVYWQQHQQYPNQLSDAHIDAGTDFRRVFYRKSAEEMPILFYRTTFIPFDTYRYNFVTQQSE